MVRIRTYVYTTLFCTVRHLQVQDVEVVVAVVVVVISLLRTHYSFPCFLFLSLVFN